MGKAAAFITACFILLASCSSKESERNEKATILGAADAIEFVTLTNNKSVQKLKIEEFLLTVRLKEKLLIETGHEKAAENYIKSFKSTLEDKDPLLYNEIFKDRKSR